MLKLRQVWANYQPGSICGTLSFKHRPATLGEMMLESQSLNCCSSSIFSVF